MKERSLFPITLGLSVTVTRKILDTENEIRKYRACDDWNKDLYDGETTGHSSKRSNK